VKPIDIVRALLGVATGGATEAVGLTARVAAFAAAVAAIAGPLAWVWSHKLELAQVWNAPMVTFTVGQAVVSGAVAGVFIYLVTLLAHRAPPP